MEKREHETEDEEGMRGQDEKVQCGLSAGKSRGILGPAVEFWVWSGCGFAGSEERARAVPGVGWPYRCGAQGGPAAPSILLGERGKELSVEVEIGRHLCVQARNVIGF